MRAKESRIAKDSDGNGPSFELLHGFNLWPTHQPLVRDHDPASNHNRVGAPKIGTHDRGATHLAYRSLL